jgi:hypothetical protein
MFTWKFVMLCDSADIVSSTKLRMLYVDGPAGVLADLTWSTKRRVTCHVFSDNPASRGFIHSGFAF